MASLCLSLLGPFQAFLDGKPVTGFDSHKTRALLAYLAVETARPHSREALAGLFWPERPQSAAMNSLRNALAILRKAIGDPQARPLFLLITHPLLQFNRESDCWVDVWELEKQSAISTQPSAISFQPSAAGGRQSAVDLYQGDFLEGFSLSGCPEFETWVLERREYYQRLALDLLRSLAEQAGQAGEWEQALAYTRRVLALEPWEEPAHRQAMLLLALLGQRSAALAQYQACQKALEAELGVEPGQETTRLYEQICAGEFAGLLAAATLSPGLVTWARESRPVAGPLFVARRAELKRLDEALRRALTGPGQAIFVSGGPGSGKTALVHAFIHHALSAHPSLAAITGRCQAYFGQGDPYLPFREALAMLTGQGEAHGSAEHSHKAGMTGQEAALRLWRSSGLAIRTLVEEGPALVETFLPGPALLERAGQVVQGRPGWLERLDEIVRSRQQIHSGEHIQQEALFYQYGNTLRALARHMPLILFLDDLQWADTGSLSLLFALGRGLAGARLLIVGAYREEEIQSCDFYSPVPSGNRHPLAAILNEFRLLFPDLILNLDEAEERPFIDAYLDGQPNRLGAAFRELLFRQTRGHPLYTIELLRGMQERGDLVRNQDGEWVEGASIHWDILPGRVEAAIAERIERLPPELRDVLQIASVEGEGFTVEAIAAVQGRDPRAVLLELSEALDHRHHLVRAEDLLRIGGQRLARYRFRHILFQKYLYSRLDPVRRADLHEQVGNALERLYGAQCGEVTGQLALHFERAGLLEKAVQSLSLAGERAASLAANQEAVAYFTRALELTPETDLEARFNLLLARWKVFDRTGQTGREAADVQALERLGEALGPAYQARAAICRLYYAIDVNMDAQQKQVQASLIQSAMTWARASGQTGIEVELCRFEADLYTDPALISPIYARGLRLARQAGLKGPEADLLRAMCINLFCADLRARIAYGEQALRLYREVGDRYNEGYALAMIGVGYRHLGDFARALHCFEQARDLCREVGNRLYETYAILGVAVAHYLSGRPDNLSGKLIEVLQTVRTLNIPWLEFHYIDHLAEFFLLEGNAAQALDYAEQTRRFYAQSGPEKSSISEVLGLYRRGRALLELGRLEEAALAFRQGLAITETSEHADLYVTSLAGWADYDRIGLAAVALRQGNPALALEQVEKGWGRNPERDYSDGWANLIFYQTFHAHADPRAGEVLEQAHRVLLEQAARISDEGMRRSFLENIPEHREIIALWSHLAQEPTVI